MNKIAFAFQVFTLMIALPLYVIIEMNHEIRPSKEVDTVTKLSREGNIISTASTQTPGYKAKFNAR